MTLVLELPASVEAALRQDAARQGTTPEALALESLRRLWPAVQETLRTGADVIAQWEAEGAFIDREGQPDSPELARKIRETAWRRTQEAEQEADGTP